LEFRFVRDDSYGEHLEFLRNLLGDSVDLAAAETRIAGQVDAQVRQLNWYWHLPSDCPKSRLRELESEKAVYEMTENWVRVPQVLLDGKSAEEVAGDPRYRPQLEALVSQFETTERNHPFNQQAAARLRQRLGMPEPAAIDPTEIDPKQLSPMRLNRVDWSRCSDDDLLYCFLTAVGRGDRVTAVPTGIEILQRESMRTRVPFDSVCGVLAGAALDDDAALDYMRRARRYAVAAGRSPGVWLVEELELRIDRGIEDKTEELYEEIQTRHMHEPAVEQRMTRLLASIGLVESEGVERGGTAVEAPAAREATPAEELAWTAKEPAPARAGSKLWLPGDP
jgi:hypothetical protein